MIGAMVCGECHAYTPVVRYTDGPVAVCPPCGYYKYTPPPCHRCDGSGVIPSGGEVWPCPECAPPKALAEAYGADTLRPDAGEMERAIASVRGGGR